MKYINLTQGKQAIVDDEDFEKVNQYKWRITRGYARGWINNKSVQMHRFILNNPINKEIDHKNGDKLDNRKINLRICSRQENSRNANTKRGISGYKGVHWYKRSNKWVVFITIDDKHKFIGYFHNKLEAANAYNEAAIKYFGEFARLNKI